MSATIPCRRKSGHRHSVTYVAAKGNRGTVSDRCRSLYLWSTLAFHVLAGDEPTLDGKPFTDAEWANGYLTWMESDHLSRGTARRLRRALARRSEAK